MPRKDHDMSNLPSFRAHI